ncbi:MAG: hypothetical protein WC827_04610 [Candidatus Paceibacterota bacterium]|jgi:hypothetical protein
MNSVLTRWSNPWGDLHICSACPKECRLSVREQFLRNLPKSCDCSADSIQKMFNIEGLLPDPSHD